MSLETFFTVSEQCSLFLLSCLLGMGIGVFFDIFRTLRIVFPPAAKNKAVFAEDVLFMVISGTAVFLYSAVFCRGQVRFFCIVGSALGFMLYIAAVGNVIIGILRKTVKFIIGLFARIKNRS